MAGQITQEQRTERLKFYTEYLQSPEWKRRRTHCLRRARFRCQICGATNRPLEAHHNNYEHLGDEWASDLIAVCHGCHWVADSLRKQRETAGRDAR